MNTSEVIRYYTDLIQEKGLSYARKALADAGVDAEIANSLEQLALASPACN